MTAAALSKISHNHIASIPAAIKALAAMEHQLSQTSTYDEIRKLVDQAEALKLLFSDIDIVKAEAEAEDVIPRRWRAHWRGDRQGAKGERAATNYRAG